MIKRFAVMGNPISHSLSPVIHQHFAQQFGLKIEYETILVNENSFANQVQEFYQAAGTGLNITAPFKQNAYRLASIHSPRCLKAEAANTLWLNRDGVLCADNTDGIGFIRDIQTYIDLQDKQILILGAGGAVRGIIPPLLEFGAHLVLANRTSSNAKKIHDLFPQIECIDLEPTNRPFDVIINAMTLNVANQLPIFTKQLKTKPFCYDLSYNHSHETDFVRMAKINCCNAVDGIGMLVEQAAEAFYLWHGYKPSTHELIKIFKKTGALRM